MKSLQALLNLFNLSSQHDLNITHVTLDSRAVKPGTLFCAVKGLQQDGHDFINEAQSRGASAIFCERETGFSYDSLFVMPNLYHRLGMLADFFYDAPSKHLKIIGVTGTNGKTSVTHYIAELLHLMGEKAAVIGTVGNGLWGNLIEGERTTPDVLSLHQMFRAYLNQGATWLAMEVSSHALDQNRVDSVRFYAAIFTNLSQDHLDYHHTMEAYGAAKAKLFHKPELKLAVLNAEDSFSKTLVKTLPLTTTCLFYEPIPASLKTQLIGAFNRSNLSAALTCLAASGFSMQILKTRAALLHPVKGRMEGLRYPGCPLIVIDYAHTPDALAKALEALKDLQKKIWVVFGCGGDRDPGKRPLMAKAAERHADKIIVTEDNSRFEPIEKIFADIRAGFQYPAHAHYIIDRKSAIIFALEHAKPDEVILLAGKGHETYLDAQGVKTYFDERDVISLALGTLNQSATK